MHEAVHAMIFIGDLILVIFVASLNKNTPILAYYPKIGDTVYFTSLKFILLKKMAENNRAINYSKNKNPLIYFPTK